MSEDISIKCVYWLPTVCSVSMLYLGCREYKKLDGYANFLKKLKWGDGIHEHKISQNNV